MIPSKIKMWKIARTILLIEGSDFFLLLLEITSRESPNLWFSIGVLIQNQGVVHTPVRQMESQRKIKLIFISNKRNQDIRFSLDHFYKKNKIKWKYYISYGYKNGDYHPVTITLSEKNSWMNTGIINQLR